MTQRDRLRSMDARFARAFFRAGLADAATYTPPAGSPVACTVMLDRNVQALGELGEVIGNRDVATLQLAEVTPAAGGTLTIGTEAWTLEKKISEDESFSEWVLSRGP